MSSKPGRKIGKPIETVLLGESHKLVKDEFGDWRLYELLKPYQPMYARALSERWARTSVITISIMGLIGDRLSTAFVSGWEACERAAKEQTCNGCPYTTGKFSEEAKKRFLAEDSEGHPCHKDEKKICGGFLEFKRLTKEKK